MGKNKILWFSITPSLYNSERDSHNGGGWIEALQRIVEKRDDIELGISFIDKKGSSLFKVKSQSSDTTYYPITIKHTIFQKIKDKFTIKNYDNDVIKHCINIVEDFKPDLIHIFGSEWCFGLIREYTDVPVVIHFQGCWPPYKNAQYPPGFSLVEKYIKLLLHPKSFVSSMLYEHFSKERALREEYILRINKYYMGRTRWDKAITFLYNQDSQYFYCSEALRPAFSENHLLWHCPEGFKFTIVSTGAGHVLKGYDVVLKTAKLLTENMKISFEWLLCGPTGKDLKLFEDKTGIKCTDVNVVALGKCSAEKVQETLLKASVYVHTSYIDNSPNAVCEAQILGLPVIATNVGGVPSLFSSEYPQDMLVPANDPYYLSAKLKELLTDKKLQIRMSNINLKVAKKRHNEFTIYNDLLHCYLSVIEESNESRF